MGQGSFSRQELLQAFKNASFNAGGGAAGAAAAAKKPPG